MLLGLAGAGQVTPCGGTHEGGSAPSCPPPPPSAPQLLNPPIPVVVDVCHVPCEKEQQLQGRVMGTPPTHPHPTIGIPPIPPQGPSLTVIHIELLINVWGGAGEHGGDIAKTGGAHEDGGDRGLETPPQALLAVGGVQPIPHTPPSPHKAHAPLPCPQHPCERPHTLCPARPCSPPTPLFCALMSPQDPPMSPRLCPPQSPHPRHTHRPWGPGRAPPAGYPWKRLLV